MIRLRSLGQCAIEVGGVRIVPDAGVLFATLLYLVVEGERHVLRAELSELVWPDIDQLKALHNLRQAVYRLKTFGVAFTGDRSHLGIEPAQVEIDFAPLLCTRSPTDAEACASGIHGPFLPAYAPRGAPRLTEWIERQRDVVNSAARRVLVSVLQTKRARGDWHGVDALAKKCLAIDPLNEEATCAFAEVAAMQGSKSTALTIIDRYLKEIGPGAREIRLPVTTLRKRISEAPPIDAGRFIAHIPFVGREEELAMLHGALHTAKAGEGSGYLIWGEAGIGKTRLVTEFTRGAEMQSVQVVRTGCQSHDERRPLSAFVDLVPKLLMLPGGLGCSPETMGFLKRLTEHDPTATTLTPAAREADVLYFNIRRSLFDLLDAIAAESCLIVVVEDVHWLDAMSWDLFAEMSGWLSTRRMMLVLTSREAMSPCATNAHDVLRLRWKRLVPLPQLACEQLVLAMSDASLYGLSETFQTWCVAQAGGNPYYLSELALQDLRVDGEYRVPTTLTALIEDRLAKLQPLSRRLLQVCSLLGKLATIDRIEAVLQQRRFAIVDSLDELERLNVIESDGNAIKCKHELLSRAALAPLADTARRLIHRHTALLIEGEVAVNQSASLLWECSEHWQRAGETERAVRQLRLCAQHLFEVGLPVEAAAALEQALRLAHSANVQLSLLAEQVSALELAGLWQDLANVLPKIRALRALSAAIHDDLELLEIDAQMQLGFDYSDISERLLQCVNAPTNDDRHKIRAATTLIMAASNVANNDAIHEVYRKMSALKPHNDAAVRDQLYLSLVYHVSFGDPPAAVEPSRTLLAHARNQGSSGLIVRTLRHCALAFQTAGRIGDAISSLTESYELAAHFQLKHAASRAACALTEIYLSVQDIAHAREWHGRVGEWTPAGDLKMINLSRATGAEIALQEGRYDQALSILSDIDAPLLPASGARQLTFMLAVRCLALLGHGQTPTQQELDRLIELHFRTRRLGNQDLSAISVFKSLEAAGRRKLGCDILLEYVSEHRRERSPLPPMIASVLQQCDPTS